MPFLDKENAWTIDWRIIESPPREWKRGFAGWGLESAIRNVYWHLEQTSYTQYRLRNMETDEIIPGEIFV